MTSARSRSIARSILEAVGDTPVLELRRLFPEAAGVFAKLELLNPGGSHKVRIAINMIRVAEEHGWLTPRSTILEPTGGNTGMGIAIAADVLGYDVVLVIPDNYSTTKQDLLRALGARIELADHRRGLNCHGERALELQFENPDWVMLNQQANPANPEAHSASTAPEILRQFADDPPELLVCGVGTGGHITGVGRTLRAVKPDLRIIAVVPPGCSLVRGRFVPHDVQGLAVGLVPQVLDTSLIDDEIEVGRDEAVAMMRRAIRAEGLTLGLSSAANLAAVEKIGRDGLARDRVLTFVYDSAVDYLECLREGRGSNPRAR